MRCVLYFVNKLVFKLYFVHLEIKMQSKDTNHTPQVEVNISKPGKVVHCSDGVIEEIEEEKVEEMKSAPQPEETVNPKTLPWGPWLSHYAWKSGNKVINAVDYAGESLASFFGITTPKYQVEIDEFDRIQAEKKAMEEESAGWVKKDGGGDVPLVLNEPVKAFRPTNNNVSIE